MENKAVISIVSLIEVVCYIECPLMTNPLPKPVN